MYFAGDCVSETAKLKLNFKVNLELKTDKNRPSASQKRTEGSVPTSYYRNSKTLIKIQKWSNFSFIEPQTSLFFEVY